MARTHCSINAFILTCVAAFAIGGMTACENTARGLQQDAAKAEAETRDERAAAAEKAKELGEDAVKAAREFGAAAAEVGDDMVDAASGKKEELDVKAALMADTSIDATRIDVDTNYFTKTVTLKGHVSSHIERDMAEVVTKAHAEGYKVINSLQVTPASNPGQ